jgi:uncharacterized protein YjbI with pentapeptide repeats
VTWRPGPGFVHWRRSRGARLAWRIFSRALGTLVLAGLIIMVLWLLRGPGVVHPDGWNKLSPAERSTATAQWRLAIIQLVVATGAAGALVFTARNYWLSRRGQVTDRFTKALERLGSSELYVRLGGVHALEQVLSDAPEQHEHIVEVLIAFIRHRAGLAAPLATTPTTERWLHPPTGLDVGEKTQSVDPDVQAALTALGRRPVRPEEQPLNLEKLNLIGVRLAGANLIGARLVGADLTNASLDQADLTDAVLRGANLTNASLEWADLTRAALGGGNLTEAWLEGVNLTDAWLAGANLTDASIVRANLTDARLIKADLTDASLEQANLTRAALGGANLFGAHLGRANLTGAQLHDSRLDVAAHGWTMEQLNSAVVDASTVFPPGLRWDSESKQVVDDSLPL